MPYILKELVHFPFTKIKEIVSISPNTRTDMIIRDLNGEPNELMVFQQNDGDIQVTIQQNTGNYKDLIILGVRIGSATSGGSVPPPIFRLLRQLAAEFEKYRECKNEVDAYNKWDKEENPL